MKAYLNSNLIQISTVSKFIISILERALVINVKRKAIWCIENSEIRDGDIIIATLVSTAKAVTSLNSEKGKKFYFIQGFENWYMSNDELYETYDLGMSNIVVSNWLKRIA